MRSMHTKWRQTWFNWHMQSVCCWIDFYRKLELIRVFSEITIQWQAVIRNNVCRLGRFMSVGSVFHFKDFSLTKANLFNNKLGKLITFWSDLLQFTSKEPSDGVDVSLLKEQILCKLWYEFLGIRCLFEDRIQHTTMSNILLRPFNNDIFNNNTHPLPAEFLLAPSLIPL